MPQAGPIMWLLLYFYFMAVFAAISVKIKFFMND